MMGENKEKGETKTMPKKQYHVILTKEQRDMLHDLISSGTARARTQAHAHIKLKHLYPVIYG